MSHVVRVVLYGHDQQGNEANLVECLRYMGLVKVHRSGDGSKEPLVFDILPPADLHGELQEQWARMNAERMRTFNLHAQACYDWMGTGPSPGNKSDPDEVKVEAGDTG